MMPWGVLALVLLLLAGLTAAATVVRSVSRIWLRHWAERRLAGAAAAEAYIDRPQRLLLSATAGATLLIVTAGMVIGAHASRLWVLLANLALFCVAMLVVGQYVPRAIGRRWARTLVPVLLPTLRAITVLVSPLAGAAQLLARAFRRPEAPMPTARDEIEDLLREGELEGIGEKEEIDIITGVVQFGDKRLRDVMRPRTDVFAVDVASAPHEMARAIAQSGYSRVPVYRGSLDEVIGMVHALDILKTGGTTLPPLRQVAFAPAAKRCSEMLFEMLRGQRHLAVVLDEFGGTAGIVTLEDMLEELVGDIRDEHDEPGPTTATASAAARASLVPGATELHTLGDWFGVTLGGGTDGRRAQTLGGALARALGRIPIAGERFRFGPLEATVVEADATRVISLLVQRAETATTMDVTLPV